MYINTTSPFYFFACPPIIPLLSPHWGWTRLGLHWVSSKALPEQPASWNALPLDPLSVLQRLHLLSQHAKQDFRLQFLGSGRHCLSGWRTKLHFQRAEIFPSLYPKSLWKPGKVCKCCQCGDWKGMPVDQRPEMDIGEKLENLQAGGDWEDGRFLKDYDSPRGLSLKLNHLVYKNLGK